MKRNIPSLWDLIRLFNLMTLPITITRMYTHKDYILAAILVIGLLDALIRVWSALCERSSGV